MPFDALAQAVLVRFHSRPTLVSVARDLFSEALKSEYPQLDIDLSRVSLNTPNWIADSEGRRIDGYQRRPLLDIVTQSITDTPRWEDPEDYYLSLGINHRLSVDMRQVEAFLQILPQAVLPTLQQALAKYWSDAYWQGETRGRWLANVIKYALLTGVTQSGEPARLDSDQADTLMQIINCPAKDERIAMYGQQCAQAYLVDYSLQTGDTRVASVSAQVLVIRKVDQREIVLSFVPSGAFKIFQALNDFAYQEGSRLGNRLLINAVDMRPYEIKGNVFVTQAQAILNHQLESLTSLEPFAGQDLAALKMHCEQLTDPAALIIDRSPEGDQQARFREVRDSLEDWLTGASDEDAGQYSRYVFDLAMSQLQSGGKAYNHDVPSVQAFASQVLHQGLNAEAARQGKADEAGSLDPDRIMVSQYRSNRTPLEVIDGDIHTQDYSVETLSLTQRALKNILGLPFILTTVKYQDDSAVPSWMTPEYLGKLISEVDIGKVYPERVKRDLLDDPSQRSRREKLYARQLRVQLPMQALKLKIRGECGFTQQGYRYIAALMDPEQAGRYVEGQEIVIGPLSFEPELEQAHSEVEHAFWKPSGEVRNMFLIGPRPGILRAPIVLYRPFHEESLIEFPSRDAFMEELRSNTPRGKPVTQPDGSQKHYSLRESVLDWLEPDARATYVSNGFNEPAARYEIDFLFFVKGTSLWHRKASHPLLSRTELGGDPVTRLYEADANIVLRTADEKTVSGDEFRWERFNATRFAIANAVLPLAQGPWAVVGGLIILAQSVKDILEAEKSGDHAPAQALLVQLLVNLGAVLLTHGLNSFGSRLISRVDELPRVPASVPRAGPGARASAAVGIRFKDAAQGARFLEKAETLVDFSTSMSGDAQALLERLSKNTPQDPGPVQASPLEGIRVVDGRWYARIPPRLRGQGWAEVSPAGGENVFLLDSQGKPVPWLQLKHNGSGLWEVAPEFRVRGGGPKKDSGKTLAQLRKEKEASKVEATKARDDRLSELSARMPALDKKLPTELSLIEAALASRNPVHRAIAELLERIDNAADAQRTPLASLLQKVQQPRLHAADLAVEKAVLNYVKLQQERLAVGREIVELYKQDLTFYKKDIVENLATIAKAQLDIYHKYQGLLVDNAIPGLIGSELFPSPTLEPGLNEWPSLDAFVKEQRRLLEGQARLIEASGALESTLDELQGFSAAGGKALRQELTGNLPTSRDWRLRELECLKRALSARSTATDAVFHRTAKDVLRETRVSDAANSQWEVLQHDGYGALERIEVLDSALKQYDLAASMGRLLESAENPPVPQDFLQRFLSRLAELKASAQEALSAQILDEDLPKAQALPEVPAIPQRKPVVKPAKKPTKKVFRSRNQQTLVGDISVGQAGEPQEVSMSDPLGGQPISYYKAEGQESWQVRVQPPALSARPGLLNALTTKGRQQLADVDAFIDWVKKPTNSTPEPVSLQEMLENRARELEKTASEIDQGLAALGEQERKPATIEVQALLRQHSARVTQEARLLRIKASRELPPSAGRFQYLLEQGEVSVAEPVWTDKSTARDTEFLLEYAIFDEKKINAKGQKEVLWYAHFHCPAKSTRFIKKGHLKLKVLRYKTYQDQLNEARNGEQVRAVKSAGISQAFADRYFFKTVH
jgi:hypothetical protein